uniref:Uncharacterized protein n=1 Tax=Timema bartmani TaxID=61472 RepID=A0A7R9EW67_9NEOP|nr:unnamed protein product [Timema bartmani]
MERMRLEKFDWLSKKLGCYMLSLLTFWLLLLLELAGCVTVSLKASRCPDHSSVRASDYTCCQVIRVSSRQLFFRERRGNSSLQHVEVLVLGEIGRVLTQRDKTELVRPRYPAPLGVPTHSGFNIPQIGESPSGYTYTRPTDSRFKWLHSVGMLESFDTGIARWQYIEGDVKQKHNQTTAHVGNALLERGVISTCASIEVERTVINTRLVRGEGRVWQSDKSVPGLRIEPRTFNTEARHLTPRPPGHLI